MGLIKKAMAGMLLLATVGSAGFAEEPRSVINKIREQCVALLRQSMTNENSFVRSATVRSAGESGDPALIDLLKKGAGDVHPTTRLFALQSLKKVSAEQAYDLAKTLLNDTDIWVRGGALEILAETGGNKTVFTIKPFLNDPDVTVRLAAATALYGLGEKKHVGIILDVLKGRDSVLKHQAIGYLGKIGSAETMPYLVSALDDAEDEIVFYALQAIGEKAGVVPFSRLRDLARHKNPSIRYQAILLLGYLPESLVLVKEFCADEDGMVRLSAAVALYRLESDACRQVFSDSLKDADFGVRSSTARILGTTPIPDRAKLLGVALRDSNSRVRTAAVRAVGMMGGPEAFTLLALMLDDSVEAIRAYAAGNLLKLLK
jgi:HEAT repeat protein